MTTIPWVIAELLPHSRSMILLDDAIDAGDDWVLAGVRVAEDSRFYEPGFGVPSWVGIEYMAQAVALYSGLLAKRAGEEVKIGLLLGARRYEAHTDRFRLGSYLKVLVREEWQDGQMGAFDCHIEAELRLAEARLNVFRPNDLATMIDRSQT